MNPLLSDFEDRKKMVNRMIFYPSSIIVCFLPLFLTRIFEAFQYRAPAPVVVVSGVAAASIGLIDTVVYGMTGAVRQAIRQSGEFFKISINLDFSIRGEDYKSVEEKEESQKLYF